MSEDVLKIEITDSDQPAPTGTEKRAAGGATEGSDSERFQVSDRRFWVQDSEAVDRAAPPPERLPSYLEELKARTEAAEGKLRERMAQLESDNEAYRQRLRREFENRAEQQTRNMLAELLDVVDNLERALQAAETTDDLEALKQGVRLNLRLFLERLSAAGITPIEVEGRPFDPHVAEAVGAVPVDSPEKDQTVVEVVQTGYLSGDQLLRPARVRIGQWDGDSESS